jgi:cell division protein FtsQ
MTRKGYPEDGPVLRPRALRVRGDAGDADDNPVGGANEPLDARLMDLEPEAESPFLRSQKRVPVRRGPLPKKAANRLKYALMASALVVLGLAAAGLVTRYGRHSWRFCLDSSDQIQLSGNRYVSRGQVLDVFGADISRNLFSIPLDERKRQLEQIPWVESATVMRLLPNRLRVNVRERQPVAFVQLGDQVKLIDATGAIMDTPPGANYSFPVILGFTGAEPRSLRAVRMRLYQSLVQELDSGGAGHSRDLSEVDPSDPEDVKVTVTDAQGEILIHLGSAHFLDRYNIFVAHVQDWRQRYQKLDSVDLRYDPQVIVTPAGGVAAPVAAPQPVPAPVAHVNTPKAPAVRAGGKKPKKLQRKPAHPSLQPGAGAGHSLDD